MQYFRFGVKLAVVFFVLATIILVVFAITLSTDVAMFAYKFTITAIIVNWIYTAMLLYFLLKRRINLLNLFKTLGVMFINIPIGLFYSWLMVFLLSFARITFVNSTGNDLRLVRIEGCQDKTFDDLKNGDSKTVWIKIKPDCGVDVRYSLQGVPRHKTVATHLIQGPASIIRFEIDR